MYKKPAIYIFIVVLTACGNQSKSENDKEKSNGSTGTAPIDTSAKVNNAVSETPAPAAAEINNLLNEKFGGTLTVLNDTLAGWPKDVFDYFIAAKRKENPDYPYIAKGDFNGDGQQDAAALVKTKDKAEYQLAVIFGSPPDKHRISFWKEDIDVCAVSAYPKGELQGMNDGSISMKGDGINVEFFEKATFVIYWDGKGFKRTYTGD